MQPEHSLAGRRAPGLIGLLLCLTTIALRSVAVSWLQLKLAAAQGMGKITFKIRQGHEDLTVVQYDSPLTVARAKQALLEENTTWIGALQEEGSYIRVGGDQALKPGSSSIFTLQRQPGEFYLRWLLFLLMTLKNAACKPLWCLEDMGFLHIRLACVFSLFMRRVNANSQPPLFVVDLIAYPKGIVTQWYSRINTTSWFCL